MFRAIFLNAAKDLAADWMIEVMNILFLTNLFWNFFQDSKRVH